MYDIISDWLIVPKIDRFIRLLRFLLYVDSKLLYNYYANLLVMRGEDPMKDATDLLVKLLKEDHDNGFLDWNGSIPMIPEIFSVMLQRAFLMALNPFSRISYLC